MSKKTRIQIKPLFPQHIDEAIRRILPQSTIRVTRVTKRGEEYTIEFNETPQKEVTDLIAEIVARGGISKLIVVKKE